MPELPEIEALRQSLGPQLQGQRIARLDINQRKGYMLRCPAETLRAELPGRTVASVARRGKHLLLELANDEGNASFLIVNPMLAGRFALGPDSGKPPANWVFGLGLVSSRTLHYMDARDMGRVYWTPNPQQDVPGWAELGPEADSLAEMGLDAFRQRWRRYRGEVKDILRNQAFLSGIGNAYSDEVLFAAHLLPLRRRASLTPEDEARLFETIPSVLKAAVTAIQANPNYVESKQDRAFMAVHGKGGGTCPRCGHRISQIGSDREPMNFCRGCQS